MTLSTTETATGQQRLLKPELLAPAGDAAGLHAALNAGADAVYFGAGELNMRRRARNFSLDDMALVTQSCREAGARAYLTLNTIIYQKELPVLSSVLEAAASAGVDAVICWDRAVLEQAAQFSLPVHLSTQASVSNARSILSYYRSAGVRRFVLARECSLEDAAAIRGALQKELGEEAANIELEAFIHGAMCVAVSGRCFMSEYSFGNSANRGECLQPCRRKYRIVDVEDKHEYELGSNYVMSPKDLCTMPFLEKILEAGFASLKIEGRMRNPEYAATVVAAYREAVDYYWEHLSGCNSPGSGPILDSPGAPSPAVRIPSGRGSGASSPAAPADSPEWKEFQALKTRLTEQLRTVFNRDFSSGFYMGEPLNAWTSSPGSLATHRKETVGIVVKYYQKAGVAEIKVQGAPFSLNDELVIQGPTTGNLIFRAASIQIEHQPVEQAQPGTHVAVRVPERVRVNDAVFRRFKAEHPHINKV